MSCDSRLLPPTLRAVLISLLKIITEITILHRRRFNEMSRIECTVARYGKWNNARNVPSCYCTGRCKRTGRLKWNCRKEICHRDPLTVKFVIINQTGHFYQQNTVLSRQINHPNSRWNHARECNSSSILSL